MRVIFSRDRPAQLDLLLRSIERYMPPEPTEVVWFATQPAFVKGYSEITDSRMHRVGGFDRALRDVLYYAEPTVTFFCDDDIVFRETGDPAALLLEDDRTLSVSLYLGRGNVKQPIPPDFPRWRWTRLPRHDFGFPCAVDGNTYRTEDVLTMIGGVELPDPTWLEVIMLKRLPAVMRKRPLMAAFEQQSLVSVPVNRVSQSNGPPYGRVFYQDERVLNYHFCRGLRIDLDSLDFSGVNSCHHEIEYVWAHP